MATTRKARCAICDERTDPVANLCYGCGRVVCPKTEHWRKVFGERHRVTAHGQSRAHRRAIAEGQQRRQANLTPRRSAWRDTLRA